MGEDDWSNGLDFRSAGVVSVEKDFGSKPRGDGDLIETLPGREGAGSEVRWSLGPPTEIFEEERGDMDGSCLGVSLVEPGEALSGLAIRRPPSDCVRFILLDMVN